MEPMDTPLRQRLGGGMESEEHQKLVTNALEYLDLYARQNQTFNESSHQWWRHWASDHDDPRGEDEAWRSNIFVPKTHAGIETKVSNLAEIMLAPTPYIQAQADIQGRAEEARNVEQLLQQTLDANKWRLFLIGAIRATLVQGLQFIKLSWGRRAMRIYHVVNSEEIAEYKQRMFEAIQSLGIKTAAAVPDPIEDPATFEEWRKMYNESGKGRQIPEQPKEGMVEIVQYEGPILEQINPCHIFYNPLIDDVSDQVFLAHRMWKTDEWVKSLAGDDPSLPFDPSLIEQHLGGVRHGGGSDDYDALADLNRLLEVPNPDENEPNTKSENEVIEIYQPGTDTPYLVMLNRAVFINKNHTEIPNGYGRVPIGQLRNIYIPGHGRGLSDAKTTKGISEEINILRRLRIDRTVLETLNVFQTQGNSALPEAFLKIKPGKVIPSGPGNSEVKQLLQFRDTNAFNDLAQLAQEHDDVLGTYGHVKGAGATVGRVTAVEAGGRDSRASIRLKLQAVTFEEELSWIAPHMLAMYVENGPDMIQVRANGPTGLVAMPRSSLLEAINDNYSFQGATKQIQKELQAQQLGQLQQQFGGNMTMEEARNLYREILDTLGVKSIEKIAGPKGDQLLNEVFSLQQQLQMIMAQLQIMQAQQQMAMFTTPNEMDSDQAARELSGSEQGQSQPGAGGLPPGQEEGSPAEAGPPPEGGEV